MLSSVYTEETMDNLKSAYNPKDVEDKWYSFWKEKKFFQANSSSKKPAFSIVMPPPNVTGTLHVGHALVNTLQDILIRRKRMQGYETLWVPGTDHAGIATQTIVEKHLIATMHKRRKDFSRDEFLSYVWQWKEEKEGTILSQLAKLGVSCDWSRLAFTMDEKRSKTVKIVFKKMYDEGLIYRGDYLINWDPLTQTALADDEVEYEEVSSFLYYFRYPIANSREHIVIATTRPETMLGDSAVAVAPDDPRYQKFIGKKVLLPFVNREIPIIADHFVDPEFGTGAVKITPAHDFNDYEVAQRHNLPIINIMTPSGHINERGAQFTSLSMLEAREAIVKEMHTLKLVEKIEPYQNRIGLSYRSKAIVEPFLSKQWFVKTSAFKKELIELVKTKKVQIIPEHWEENYFYWIENLRDWCISRQLWWGHRIPIWYNKKDPKKMLCYSGEGEPPEIAHEKEFWYQDEDVLDTWFSSALWPFSVLDWEQNSADFKKFYPTSVLVTAHDIIFFWVARMILMGKYVTKEVPFHKTFLHGLIYSKSYWRKDKDGNCMYLSAAEKAKYDLGTPVPPDIFSKWEKMSKSKGNVINPLEMIDLYGTDSMRLTLCSVTTSARQIELDRRRFEEFKNFANKLWNATRFIISNLSGLTLQKGLDEKLFTIDDKWILSRLSDTLVSVNKNLDDFAFDKAALTIYTFFWDDVCDYYLELSKPFLFGKTGTPDTKENKQKILLNLLTHTILLLHPIAPFITEEIFAILKSQFKDLSSIKNADPYTAHTALALIAPACIVAPYPQPLQKRDLDSEKLFDFLKEVLRAIRSVHTEMKIPPSQKCDLYLVNAASLKDYENILKTLTRTDKIYFVDSKTKLPKSGSTALIENMILFVPMSADLLEKEKERLIKEKEKILKNLQGVTEKLSLPDFVAKAPPAIVQKMQESRTLLEKQLKEIEQKLH